jgi:hypothetical protein
MSEKKTVKKVKAVKTVRRRRVRRFDGVWDLISLGEEYERLGRIRESIFSLRDGLAKEAYQKAAALLEEAIAEKEKLMEKKS